MRSYNLPWNPYRLDALGRTALGAVSDPHGILGTAHDPILKYGNGAAALIMSQIRNVPASHRKVVLKAVLDQLDPTLYDSVAAKAATLVQSKSTPPGQAVAKALAVSMANGFGQEVVKKGQGQRVATGYYSDLSGLKFAPGAFFKKLGKGVADVAKKIGSDLKNLACVAANSGLLDKAAAAGGAAVGIPPTVGAEAAGIGVGAIKNACNKGGGGPSGMDTPASGVTGTHIAVGGGILAALFLL